MGNKIRLILFCGNFLLLLIFFSSDVLKKEEILASGKLILFRLAPVDPRSLMQGDYMQLRYAITANAVRDSVPNRGYCLVKLSGQNVAEFVRFQVELTPVEKGEHFIRYYYNDKFVSIGAESFFFQEGKDETFAKAEYGGIRVDEEGNSILTGLYDKDLKQID